MIIDIDFKRDEDIWAIADNFRMSKKLHGQEIPPIDVIYIVEVILKLDVIPLQDLFKEQRMDAALLSDLSGFYIDEEAYLLWETGDRWIENRLRFSFAHELGHLLLHQKEIKQNNFVSIDDFKNWAGNASNQRSAEYQANEFAGRLRRR